METKNFYTEKSRFLGLKSVLTKMIDISLKMKKSLLLSALLTFSFATVAQNDEITFTWNWVRVAATNIQVGATAGGQYTVYWGTLRTDVITATGTI